MSLLAEITPSGTRVIHLEYLDDGDGTPITIVEPMRFVWHSGRCTRRGRPRNAAHRATQEQAV